jgi:hypothetical protein
MMRSFLEEGIIMRRRCTKFGIIFLVLAGPFVLSTQERAKAHWSYGRKRTISMSLRAL